MKPFDIPTDLKLGSATAATQIEGDDGKCNWSHWAMRGKTKGVSGIPRATDHWNRVEEDTALLSELNQECYRMGIEWSRVEPDQDQWSQEGLDHYVTELQGLRDAGIEPLITLHHFSCPQWLQEQGAWTNPGTIDRFLLFVEKVVTALGSLAAEYCTINEPNVFVNDTYMDGKYPGGRKDDTRSYFRAARNLIKAHLKAYELIHRTRSQEGYSGETKVGFAHHLAYFEVVSSNPLTKLSEGMMDWSFHTLFFKGMVEGKLVFPLGAGKPEGRNRRRADGYFCDFLGVNYYSRHIIKSTANPAALFGTVTVQDDLTEDRKNDLGWEIYPQGLSKVIRKATERYDLPVYITENGIADADDAKRPRFLYEHLKEVTALIASGVDVRKYFHWSFLDNLEWDDGYGPRFGLVHVDYDSLERTVRPSGYFYAQLIRSRGVTDELIHRYLE